MHRIVRGLLKEMGCNNADEAEDGQAALHMLKAQKFDFLVSDINMPNMNGFDLLKAIKADDSLKHLPVLMVTAEARKEDIVLAAQCGAVLNFVKDVERRTAEVDGHLTDIMLAQDFHDLTGQVLAKVVALAGDLEDSLVKLLVQGIPADQVHKVRSEMLHGPVVNPEGRTDVVADQGEVDDLLASLGF